MDPTYQAGIGRVKLMSKNPFHFNRPTRPEDFIERYPTIEQIANDLADWDGESFGIVGGRRFGKSSMLQALEDTLIKKLEQAGTEGIHVVPVYVSLKAISHNESASA